MNSRRLVVVGAGGHGRETVESARASGWNVIGVTDDGLLDEVAAARLQRLGLDHLGPTRLVAERGYPFVIGIGNPASRERIAGRLSEAEAVVLVDHQARIGRDVELAPGVIVAPNAVCTTNVRIGEHSHLNVAAVVSHDCRIGRFVSLSPGVLINGNVTIGDRVFLGTGATVIPGLTVGDGAIIGAGAVVTDDVPAGATVRGIPAR